MSSGEGAKPTSYEERNPFDISRRSQNEVAAEIAERMAAWKRARGRSYAASPAPGTPPSSPVAPKAPAIAAPVQPARLPKFGEQAARAAMPASEARPSGLPVPPRPRAEAGTAGARGSTPAASSATAVQRAMPPAPTLRSPAAPTEPAGARAETPSGLLDVAVHRRADAAEAVPVPDDMPPADAPSGEARASVPAADSHAAEAAMSAPAAPAGAAPEAPQMAMASGAESSDRDERPVDAPKAVGLGVDRLVAEGAVQAASHPEAAAAKADQAEARELAAQRADTPVPPGLDRPSLDRSAPDTTGADSQAPAASMPAVGTDVRSTPTPEPVMPRIDALAAEMHEAELMARTRAAAATLTTDGDAARATPHKPLFDLRAARARASQGDAPARLETEAATHDGGRAPEDAGAMPAMAEPAGEMRDAATIQPGGSSFEAFDREAYRVGSPTIELPATDPQIGPAGEESDRSKDRDRLRSAGAPGDAAFAAAAGAEGRASAPAGSAPAAPTRRLRIAAPAPLTIEPADPQPRVVPAGIELPSIETRIEARRIGTLRADPWIAGRRPIFPHIQPEAWNVPAAARSRRQRSGTGWAIGLGALLLIVGITAPAAIWQGRQATQDDQDQVATLAPSPAPETAPQAASQAPSQAASHAQPDASPAPPAAAPDQPQHAAPPPPASQTQAATPSSVPAEPQVGSAAPEEEAADKPAKQAALAPVRESGELNKAPVTSPPPPSGMTPALSPAGKAVAEPPAEPDRAFSPVAHAFVPEAAPKPTAFQPEVAPKPTSFQPKPSPGTAVASVPANGASVPIEGSPESVALKPSLIGQLKPQAAPASTAGAAPQRAAQKPRAPYPQPLDQMFQNLIDTLSSGQPVNSSSKPIPPSTRR